MVDLNMEIYNVLLNDEFISTNVNIYENVYFNKYPDTATIKKSSIVIDEISDPENEVYGDDSSLAMSQIIQVDVFIKANPTYNARLLRNKISQRISDLLEDKLRMAFVSSGRPEYDDDLKIYRSVRRYEGTFYKDNYNN